MHQAIQIIGGRIGWLALCLVPLFVGVGRSLYIYFAPAQGIAYPYHSVALSLADGLVALTCLGRLAWRWRSGAARLPGSGSGFVLGAFGLLALAAAASVPAAFDRLLAIGVTAQLVLLVVFFLATSELHRHFSRRLLLIAIALAVVAESLLAGWQAVAQTTAPAGALFNGWNAELTAHGRDASVVLLPLIGRWLRSYGSFPHPNILGGFLAVSLALLVLHDAPGSRRLRVAALAMGFTALLLTFSRAAWLAVLLGGLTWLLASGWPTAVARIPGRYLVAIVAAMLAVAALVRIDSQGSLIERNSIDTRLFYNAVAWQVISLGKPVGAGNLVVAQQHLLGAASAGNEPAHDVFLIGLAELGPLGLVAWGAIFASLLLAAWQRRANPQSRAGPLVAASVLAPLLLFDHYLWTQPGGRVLLVWSVALFVAVGTSAATARPEEPVVQLRPLAQART